MRRALFIVAVLAFAVLAGVWFRRTPPVYQGQPLAYWLEKLDHGATWRDGREAILAMGHDSVPFLVDRISRLRPSIDRFLQTVVSLQNGARTALATCV